MARRHNIFTTERVDVSGIFTTRDDLNRVLEELEKRGLREDTSVLMSDRTRDYYGEKFATGRAPKEGSVQYEHSSKLPEGATAGGVTGGLLGAIIGGLSMVGSLVVPGFGLLAAGPLVGLLSGGAIGAAAGGLIGALIGAGIPEEEAHFYEKRLQEEGAVLVIAHVPPEQADDVRALFSRYGGLRPGAV